MQSVDVDELVMQYGFLFEGVWNGKRRVSVIGFPQITTKVRDTDRDDGEIDAAIATLRARVKKEIERKIGLGKKFPLPKSMQFGKQNLTEQANIRLSTEEKTALENLAAAKGFSGLSDYIRSVMRDERRNASKKPPE